MKRIAMKRLIRLHAERESFKSDAYKGSETKRAFVAFGLAEPLRAMLLAGGIRFEEENYTSGSRYFRVYDPFDAKRTARIRVSDHEERKPRPNLASIHPGGDTVDTTKAKLVAWLRAAVRA